MTIHKSNAVSKGISPDYARAGVVLCRSAEVNIASEGWTIASADTVQMVPIPNGAKVLAIQLFNPTHFPGAVDTDVGYGGDKDAFFDGLNMSTYNRIAEWPADAVNMTYAAVAGFLHTFTAADTIDIAFQKMCTSATLGSIHMAVYYKMTGVIEDES